MRCWRRAAVVGTICVLVLPAVAHGQALDPDSPAGVEYQLPLDQARKNAAGAGGEKTTAGRAPGARAGAVPLFGAGVVAAKGGGAEAGGEPQGGSGGTATDAAGDRGRSRTSAGAEGSARGGDAPGVAVTRAALASSDEDGGSNTLRTAAIALAVLLLGTLLGLLLRRGLRHSES